MEANLAATGSWMFIQSCARIMGAAWINQQIFEAPTGHPDTRTGAMAWQLRHTLASDVGMGFELAIKSLLQGLSPNLDGEPQVPRSHDQIEKLWPEVPRGVRDEVDRRAEEAVCNKYGDRHEGKVLPLAVYLKKHDAFLNGTVESRYGIEGAERWQSDHIFVAGAGLLQIASGNYNGRPCVDGKGVLMAYWWSTMKTAHVLRWRQEDCDRDERLAANRDEAWTLVEKARHQMVTSPVPGAVYRPHSDESQEPVVERDLGRD